MFEVNKLLKIIKLVTLALLVVCATNISASSQTSVDFNKKYGAPIVKESYLMNDNFILTTSFGEDDEVCEAIIKPREDKNIGAAGRNITISKETAMRLVEEVVPEGEWESPQRRPSISFSGGCSSVEMFGKSSIEVYLYKTCTLEGVSEVESIKIRWKNRTCKSLTHFSDEKR